MMSYKSTTFIFMFYVGIHEMKDHNKYCFYYLLNKEHRHQKHRKQNYLSQPGG